METNLRDKKQLLVALAKVLEMPLHQSLRYAGSCLPKITEAKAKRNQLKTDLEARGFLTNPTRFLHKWDLAPMMDSQGNILYAKPTNYKQGYQ